MPAKLILIRHGETDYNKKRICQGWEDIPLNKTGKKQAKRLVQTLKHETIDVFFTSDLKRAIQTAQPLAELKKIKLIQSSLLRERHMGIFQGLSWNQIKRQYPDLVAKLDDSSDPTWKIPGGESRQELNQRINNFLRALYDKHSNQSVAILTHGGTKRAILSLLGFVALASNTFIANTDITIIEKTNSNGYQIRTTTTTPRDLSLPWKHLLQSSINPSEALWPD